jgi:hypothetical protein
MGCQAIHDGARFRSWKKRSEGDVVRKAVGCFDMP